MFSSTMMPQSVQTAEPEGPRDSMEWEPQLGQRGALEDEVAAVWVCWVESAPLSADSSFQKLSSCQEDMAVVLVLAIRALKLYLTFHNETSFHLISYQIMKHNQAWKVL